MELGLSLGDSNSRPFAIDQFNEKPRDHHQASSSSQVLGSGFNTTLSIGPIQRDHQQQEKAKPKKDNIINSSNNNSDRGEVHHEATDEYPSLSSKSNNPVLHQLDLLPRLSFPWLPPSENGKNQLFNIFTFKSKRVLIFKHGTCHNTHPTILLSLYIYFLITSFIY